LATERGNGANATWTCDIVEQDLALPAEEVHVWRTSLEQPPAVVARLHDLLASDERARAARFRFERDRSRYVVGRARLRQLLGAYLRRAPADITFAYGAFDKPFLAGRELWFNLSHSGAVALYAFSRAGELGIDVELDGPDFARERIAERFFAPGEVAALRALPAELQPRAFLHCWTRKEAFIKARGDGLSLALDSFEVSLDPGAPARLLRTAFAPAEAERWRLEDLSDTAGGFIAALAHRAGRWTIVKHEVKDTNETGTMPRQENQ
jgi:4'-phosphopantetheinyl transferase